MHRSFSRYIGIFVVSVFMMILTAGMTGAASPVKLAKPPLSERWFGIYVDNERTGFYRQIITELPEGYRMQGDGSVRIKVMGVSKEAISREVYRVGKGLALRSFEVEEIINGTPTRLTGTVSDSVMKIRIESNGKTTNRQLKVRGEVIPGPALNLYPLMRGVAAGKTVKIYTFDPEDIKVKVVKISVQGEEQAPGGQAALKLDNDLYPFVSNEIWIDVQGNTILESVRNGLVTTKAEDPKELAAYVGATTIARKDLIYDFSLVRSEPAVKAQAKLKGLSVEISGWPDSLPLPQEGTQAVGKSGVNGVVIKTGTAIAAKVPPGATPVAGGAFANFLKSDDRMESDAPEIKARAGEVTKGIKGETDKARALSLWTSNWLNDSMDDGGGAVASLESRKGNCQTHARLYTALARAAGIPTRFVSGLVSQEGKGFLYHSWAESFLDGRWVPVDPTYNQLPADPTHLKLFEGHTQQDAAPIIAIIGKINIKVLEALY